MRERGDGRKKLVGAEIGELLRASALMAGGGNLEKSINGRKGKRFENYT